jgi:hypothetical protein
MKKQIYFITILLMLAGTFTGWAQKKTLDDWYLVIDTVNGKPMKHYYSTKAAYENIRSTKQKNIDALLEKKRLYESNQRTGLAEMIEDIDERVANNEKYTREMAQHDKESTAEQFAERINTHNNLINSQIEFEKVSNSLSNGPGSNIIASFEDGINIEIKNSKKKSSKQVTTSSGPTLALGYNFINGDNLDINDFSYGNNNYFSIGYSWKRMLNKSQTIRFKYGFEYQTQGTELNGNRAFSISDPNNTQIERLSFNAKKAKFRQDQLVFPLHFEIGGTDRKEYEDGRVRYSEYDQFKIGIGGYAGLNLRSQVKYKFELENEDIKQTTVSAFDNNVLVYGLDAYVGFDNWTLFGRMALNDIFQSGSVDGQYVAFGVRFQ